MELPTRRLALFFVVISGVLGLYVLCVSLQIQVPWHMMTFDTFRPLSTRTPEVYNGRNSLLVDASEVTTIKESPLKVTKRPTTHPKRPTTTTTTTTTKTTTTTTTVSPTKPDFFGDRYASDNVPLQTSCPDSIRTKVPLSSFANKFLGTIPVLQWAKSVSMAEYQRLKNYPGAHGWGGLGYPLIQSTLSVLNSTANRVMCDDWEQRPNRTQCIRCAVVGNGGILKDSKKGLEIDQHDYVFRTNGAVIKGFEQDVGSRTSFYTFSTNTMRNSIRSYAGQGYNGPPISEETRYVFLPDHNRDYILMRASALHLPIESGPERTKTPPKYFGANASVGKFKMYHPDFVRYLRNRFLRSSILNGKYKNIYRPSTGATMLLAALHSCDQVSAYGFMTPNYKNFSDHYYDKQYHGVAFYANHDFRLEMRLWQELHQAGLLNLYMRP